MNDQNAEHRISCHRCGNIRKRRVHCINANCPHTFCGRCSDKLKIEYGCDVFAIGCPVCQELCCCTKKSVTCTRQYHCYRKCPATKSNPKLYCQEISKSCGSPKSVVKQVDSSAESSDNESTQRNSHSKYLTPEVRHHVEDREEQEEERENKRQKVEQLTPPPTSFPPIHPELNIPVNDTVSYMIVPPPLNGMYGSDYRPHIIPIFPFYVPLHPVPFQPLEAFAEGKFESGIDLLASISSYNYMLEQTKLTSCQ